MLNIESVTKSYGSQPALIDASLRVGEGELVCLLGPSGCGKSTLLRIISGLISADAGRIQLDGQDVSNIAANKRPTAMVFQSHALWNHMSVEDNVAFGLKVRKFRKSEIENRINSVLDLVGLSGFQDRRPSELSGGQAQRVALARCLVVEPKVLLMDEPFSALDAHLRQNLREELKRLQNRLKLTTVFVTHDQEEAMELADRIVVMSQGKIEQIGSPGTLYQSPQTLNVARFLGTMNEHPVNIVDGTIEIYGLVLKTTITDGPAHLTFRPEDIEITDMGLQCRVERVADLGSVLKVSLTGPENWSITWFASRQQAPKVGSDLCISPKKYQLYRDDQLFVG